MHISDTWDDENEDESSSDDNDDATYRLDALANPELLRANHDILAMVQDVPEEEEQSLYDLMHELANTPLYLHSEWSCLQAIVLIEQYILTANINKTNSQLLLSLICSLLPKQQMALPHTLCRFLKVSIFPALVASD
jgi:hypothetical protein